MYKAELSLDQTNVQELLIAADMIQLKEASVTSIIMMFLLLLIVAQFCFVLFKAT